MGQNLILRSTHELLQGMAEELQNKLTNLLPAELKRAYETGGQWHDNPHWDGLVADQERLAHQLREMVQHLRSPTFIDEMKQENDGKITVGKQVEVEDLQSGEKKTWKLVGSADIQYNPRCQTEDFASYFSPIGRALIGKRVGERIAITIPAGIKRVKVLSIGPIRLD